MQLSNELIFIIHASLISFGALGALRLGKEALVGFICLLGILANLFVTKQITLLNLNATASDAYTIGIVISFNLLQEYYGKALAQKTVWISFFILTVYSLAAYLHLSYIPCLADTMHPHFAPILEAMPRIVVASLTAYLMTQHLDIQLYAFLKKIFAGRMLVLRSCISIMLCQALDTVLFSMLGLYGLVDNIGQIMLVSYTIKLAALIIATPYVALSRYSYRP